MWKKTASNNYTEILKHITLHSRISQLYRHSRISQLYRKISKLCGNLNNYKIALTVINNNYSNEVVYRKVLDLDNKIHNQYKENSNKILVLMNTDHLFIKQLRFMTK